MHTYIHKKCLKYKSPQGSWEVRSADDRKTSSKISCVCTCVCVCGYGIYRSKEKNALQKKIQSSLQTFYPEGVTPRWGGVASL